MPGIIQQETTESYHDLPVYATPLQLKTLGVTTIIHKNRRQKLSTYQKYINKYFDEYDFIISSSA